MFFTYMAVFFQVTSIILHAKGEAQLSNLAMLMAIYCGVMLCAENIEKLKGGK